MSSMGPVLNRDFSEVANIWTVSIEGARSDASRYLGNYCGKEAIVQNRHGHAQIIRSTGDLSNIDIRQ